MTQHFLLFIYTDKVIIRMTNKPAQPLNYGHYNQEWQMIAVGNYNLPTEKYIINSWHFWSFSTRIRSSALKFTHNSLFHWIGRKPRATHRTRSPDDLILCRAGQVNEKLIMTPVSGHYKSSKQLLLACVDDNFPKSHLIPVRPDNWHGNCYGNDVSFTWPCPAPAREIACQIKT